jgi:hypothetical protein
MVHSLLSNNILHAEFGDLNRHDSARSVAMFNLYCCDRSI